MPKYDNINSVQACAGRVRNIKSPFVYIHNLRTWCITVPCVYNYRHYVLNRRVMLVIVFLCCLMPWAMDTGHRTAQEYATLTKVCH